MNTPLKNALLLSMTFFICLSAPVLHANEKNTTSPASEALPETEAAMRTNSDTVEHKQPGNDITPQWSSSGAYDYWIGGRGAFHLSGSYGKGIFHFGKPYDSQLSYVDAYPIGSKKGVTYKMNGYNFYLFFAINTGNGCNYKRYYMAWSRDNKYFKKFQCAR